MIEERAAGCIRCGNVFLRYRETNSIGKVLAELPGDRLDFQV